MRRRILIIDDEESACKLLSLALRRDYDIRYATSACAGLALVEQEDYDLVLLDLMIGDDDGIEVLGKIKDYDPSIAVIMITAFGNVKTSVDAMKRGAFTYLSKPLDLDELRVFIAQAMEVRRLSEDISFLTGELKQHHQYQEMIGKSPQMQRVYQIIEKIKNVDSNVTITGESGTGKELAARAIHYSGKRKNGRFVVINCAAIPENLLEGELFGHKRGAFTGATQDRKGRFELADKGTIFLDEIGDMPLGLQSKLLRVLQQKEFSRLGCSEVRKVDVRIIAATNCDLDKLVGEGKFREDLFYRLQVMNIAMPPLRERKEDIPLLCSHFIKRFNREQNKQIKRLSPQAEKLLMAYDYPGNIRQLANILEYATILSTGEEIVAENLPIEVRGRRRYVERKSEGELPELLANLPLKEIERIAIQATLEKNKGHREKTANILGISRRSLLNKINEYKLEEKI